MTSYWKRALFIPVPSLTNRICHADTSFLSINYRSIFHRRPSFERSLVPRDDNSRVSHCSKLSRLCDGVLIVFCAYKWKDRFGFVFHYFCVEICVGGGGNIVEMRASSFLVTKYLRQRASTSSAWQRVGRDCCTLFVFIFSRVWLADSVLHGTKSAYHDTLIRRKLFLNNHFSCANHRTLIKQLQIINSALQIICIDSNATLFRCCIRCNFCLS